MANTEPQAQVDKDENLAEKDYEDIGHNRFDEHHTRHMIASRGKRSSHDFRISGKSATILREIEVVLFLGITKNALKFVPTKFNTEKFNTLLSLEKIREINLHYDLFVKSLISRKFLEISLILRHSRDCNTLFC